MIITVLFCYVTICSWIKKQKGESPLSYGTTSVHPHSALTTRSDSY